MFCYDMNGLENFVGAFNQDDVRIWSLLKILVHCLSNWLIIELHFPVTPAVGYGVVKIDASNYWMFLHPIVGCTSNYWITSNSWILAQTDMISISISMHFSMMAFPIGKQSRSINYRFYSSRGLMILGSTCSMYWLKTRTIVYWVLTFINMLTNSITSSL